MTLQTSCVECVCQRSTAVTTNLATTALNIVLYWWKASPTQQTSWKRRTLDDYSQMYVRNGGMQRRSWYPVTHRVSL